MNNKFSPLNCEQDVLLFEKETLTVGRFQELVYDDFYNKFPVKLGPQTTINLFKTVSIKEACLNSGDIKWTSSREGIYCQLLRIGAKGWQPGKLRLQVTIKFIPETNQKFRVAKLDIQVYLEFCADEPDEQKLPLDDIRVSELYNMTFNRQES